MRAGAGTYHGGMSESWTWVYLDAEGEEMTGEGLATTEFPSQSEAENWFGESWHDLADVGVDAVTLYRDGDPVYGPMSLRAAE